MKYFRTILSAIILAILFAFNLHGQPVESEDVLSISENFISVYFRDDPRKIEDISIRGTEEQPLLYIVNLSPEGWILVSGNKGASPVIGFNYTDKFVFPEENTRNPAYNWLIQSSDQLLNLYSDPADNEHPAWVEGFDYERLKSAKTVSPLIEAEWGQGSGWNQFCPYNSEGPDDKALVGCVAVAMAQALSVYAEPDQGTGSNSYVHDTYGLIQNDFTESLYHWDLMSADTPDQYNALLLYDCATAVDMDFGGTGSSATTSDAARALYRHFGMADNAIYLTRVNFSTADWEERIIYHLENGLPIIYRGRHDDGGHAFNLDGVVDDNYFHINWGWTGNSNGYFLLNDLSPGSRTYNESQAAIFRIQPATAVDIEDEFYEVFELYPNPTSSIVRINNISTDQISKIRLFSVNGALVRSLESGSITQSIDLSDLDTGMYIFEAILNDNTIIRRKVIKQ